MKLDALAFGAHADDVEIGCSGTIIKLGALGHTTGVIALTKGEMATRGTPELRAEEFKISADILGLSVHKMLDIPDGRIDKTWENKTKIIKEIRTYKPRIVFAPYWITRHPDHEQTSQLVRDSVYLSGLKKIDTDQEPFRPNMVIYYQSRYEFKPSFIVDISDFHQQKMNAILAYKSQFYSPDQAKNEPGEETSISRPDFLDRIETRDKQYGIYIGVQYGEPFLIRTALKLDNLVDFFGPEYLETIP